MKTILKDKKLYKYNELSKEAKEKAGASFLTVYLASDMCLKSFKELIKSNLEFSKVDYLNLYRQLKKCGILDEIDDDTIEGYYEGAEQLFLENGDLYEE